jgi:serine/threonine protein kinase
MPRLHPDFSVMGYSAEAIISDESTNVVYLVSSLQTGDKYALKVPARGSDQTQRELQFLRTLSHPHILRFRDTFRTAGGPAIVFDWAAGGDLFTIIGQGRVPEPECKKIFFQILQAIQYLHARNICHGDIKPENILFIERSPQRSTVVLCDFGFAIQHADTLCEERIGFSREFEAPELLSGGPYTNKIDMWALGITLYTALTALPATSEDDMEEEIREGLPDLFTWPEPDFISRDAEDLIRKLLMIDPQQRLSAKKALNHQWFDSVRPCEGRC